MAKKSAMSESPKAGTPGGKTQAKASADKSSKKDVKPSKTGKKEK
ncbi:hypothetical protein [Methanosarcina barkeri]|nr:hypothetical protein [Methanosarcina barkeri]